MSKNIDRRVMNEALNRMQGREFDMFEFILEKAIVRAELLEEMEVRV